MNAEHYGWAVTYDHLDHKRVKVLGPSDITDELEQRLNKGEGVKFKMYDDDGELYYSGRLVLDPSDMEVVTPQDYEGYRLPLEASLPEECVMPLHDYGLPNAGAVEIRYQGTGDDKRWAMA